MMTTIEGFKIAMTAKELIEHLELKAASYDADADALGAVIRVRLEGGGRAPNRGDDRVPDVDDVKTARDRAKELRFLAAHVVVDATYRLDATDLEYIELTERGGVYWPRRLRRVSKP